MGAWIETRTHQVETCRLHVAPRVGAWIETTYDEKGWIELRKSHPVWVRGLKHLDYIVVLYLLWSHPVWVRGLKHSVSGGCYGNKQSHPVWVRGLKPSACSRIFGSSRVAPRVGAWIETEQQVFRQIQGMSHPVWVRGLKHLLPEGISFGLRVAPRVGAWIETPCSNRLEHDLRRRTPCGCVD